MEKEKQTSSPTISKADVPLILDILNKAQGERSIQRQACKNSPKIGHKAEGETGDLGTQSKGCVHGWTYCKDIASVMKRCR